MAQLDNSTSGWSEDAISFDTSANGYVEGLDTDMDAEEERQTYRASLAALEAEVRRLNLELRAALEAKVDQEASHLAREHGFLSPFVSKSASFFSTTPQSQRFFASQPSPMGLNASNILDDDAGFSFEGLQSPAMTSSVSKPRDFGRDHESPTSRLFRTPSRPRPLTFITAPRNATPQHTPQFLRSDLVPLPESEDEIFLTSPAATTLSQSDNMASSTPRRVELQDGDILANGNTSSPNKNNFSASTRLATSAPPPHTVTNPHPPHQTNNTNDNHDQLSSSLPGSSTPSSQLFLPPIQLTPESDAEGARSSSRANHPTQSPSLPRETPKRTPMKNVASTPAQSRSYGQFATPSIIRQGNALSHQYNYGSEPEARVLTKLVYVPKTTHWCEHICLILFILLVIAISFAFGAILSQTGPPTWLQSNTAMYS